MNILKWVHFELDFRILDSEGWAKMVLLDASKAACIRSKKVFYYVIINV